jgi:hypothetical protein
MRLNLWLGLRLGMGCLAQSLRHSDNPSLVKKFATDIYCKPKSRYRTSC